MRLKQFTDKIREEIGGGTFWLEASYCSKWEYRKFVATLRLEGEHLEGLIVTVSSTNREYGQSISKLGRTANQALTALLRNLEGRFLIIQANNKVWRFPIPKVLTL